MYSKEIFRCVTQADIKGYSVVHFTVVCSVTWPLSGREAGVDLVLLQCVVPEKIHTHPMEGH